MIRPVLILAALMLLPAARAQDVAATIKAGEYALGMIRGPRRIDAINTLEYWGTGILSVAGQSSKVNYHASLSYAVPGMRVDMTREGSPRRIEVVNGQFAWNESSPGAGLTPGTTATPAVGTVAERLLLLWTTPFGVLKSAERAGVNVKASVEGGQTVLTFPLSGPLAGIMVRAALNSMNQLERVETRSGGALTETTYSGYKDLGEIASDVLFPSHIVRKQGGLTVLDLTVTKTDPNNPYVIFPVPESIQKLGLN